MLTFYILPYYIISYIFQIFGSMEVMGNPLSLFENLGTGFAMFYRKTKSEMIGDSKSRGAGVNRLARSLVGNTFGSVSKISGSLADIVQSVAGLDTELNTTSSHLSIINYESDVGGDDATKSTKYMTAGIKHGSRVFAQSVVNGFSGLVESPLDGYRESGLSGGVTGLVKGIIGIVASPLTGALGAMSVVTQSVEMSSKFRHGGPAGRRRKEARVAKQRSPFEALSPFDIYGTNDTSLSNTCLIDCVIVDNSKVLPKSFQVVINQQESESQSNCDTVNSVEDNENDEGDGDKED